MRWGLALKPSIIQQTKFGLSFCGYRLHPHRLRPGCRRLARFSERIRYWQQQFDIGNISASGLQQNVDALLAMVQPGESWQWRHRCLQRLANIEV